MNEAGKKVHRKKGGQLVIKIKLPLKNVWDRCFDYRCQVAVMCLSILFLKIPQTDAQIMITPSAQRISMRERWCALHLKCESISAPLR